MNCEHVRVNLDDFVRGELDRETGQELFDHIKGCSACRKEGALARRVAEGVKELRVSAPPSLLLAIHAEKPPVVRGGGFRLGGARAIAAMLVVGVIAWLAADRIKESPVPDERKSMEESGARPMEAAPEEPVSPPVLDKIDAPEDNTPHATERSAKKEFFPTASSANKTASLTSDRPSASEPRSVAAPAISGAVASGESSETERTEGDVISRLSFEGVERQPSRADRDTSATARWQPKMSIDIPVANPTCVEGEECTASK